MHAHLHGQIFLSHFVSMLQVRDTPYPGISGKLHSIFTPQTKNTVHGRLCRFGNNSAITASQSSPLLGDLLLDALLDGVVAEIRADARGVEVELLAADLVDVVEAIVGLDRLGLGLIAPLSCQQDLQIQVAVPIGGVGAARRFETLQPGADRFQIGPVTDVLAQEPIELEIGVEFRRGAEDILQGGQEGIHRIKTIQNQKVEG